MVVYLHFWQGRPREALTPAEKQTHRESHSSASYLSAATLKFVQVVMESREHVGHTHSHTSNLEVWMMGELMCLYGLLMVCFIRRRALPFVRLSHCLLTRNGGLNDPGYHSGLGSTSSGFSLYLFFYFISSINAPVRGEFCNVE